MTDPSLSEDQRMLDELGQLHRAERAPVDFRQRLLARLVEAPAVQPRRTFERRAARGVALACASAAVVLLLVARSFVEVHSKVVVGAEPRVAPVSVEPTSSRGPAELGADPEPASPGAVSLGCPQRLMPADPLRTDADVIRAGLTVHTFEADTVSCGPIVRRYLAYVPKSLPTESSAALLLILHGGPDRAENMRGIQTQRRFEALAARDGFIVVYASAVPSKDSDPKVPNEGRWRTADYYNPQVDDEEYLLRVVEDLVTRGVTDGSNAVFLVGHAEGAAMALQAAAHRPDFYSGVAAVMPYKDAFLPFRQVPGARLSRALFVLFDGIGRDTATDWASAFGVPERWLREPRVVRLPDRVVEGKGQPSVGAIARATRDSSVKRIDMSSPERGGPAVRVFDIEHAGHFWPVSSPKDSSRSIESFGFRNEDIDGADEAWKFLSGAEPAPYEPAAADIVLEGEVLKAL